MKGDSKHHNQKNLLVTLNFTRPKSIAINACKLPKHRPAGKVCYAVSCKLAKTAVRK